MPKKRRAPSADDVDVEVFRSSSMSDEKTSGSDHSFDISSALTLRKSASWKGKAPLLPHDDGIDDDDDTELEEMIRDSISKRNVKNSTELLKNTKGKKKLTKGELGGGSFQSMGTPSGHCL